MRQSLRPVQLGRLVRRFRGRAIVGKMAVQRTHQPGYQRLRDLMEPPD